MSHYNKTIADIPSILLKTAEMSRVDTHTRFFVKMVFYLMKSLYIYSTKKATVYKMN
jgi:hypothetical protein